mgnify:CR=1 FL=1
MMLGEANRTSEFRIVLAGPKFAGQDRVIREKITVEVILRELGSEEFNDIVIHEKLVKGVRIVHVGAIDRSDVCWRILEIIAVFEECSKYFEGLCSGGWCTNFTRNNSVELKGTHRFSNCPEYRRITTSIREGTLYVTDKAPGLGA